MDYKSMLYRECLEIAEELLWEDKVRTDFPYWQRQFIELDGAKEYYLEAFSDLEKIDIAQQMLMEAIEKDCYKNPNSKQTDLEWLEAFMEWRDIYNERILAKTRVF
jgi:hypothetical protein